MADTTQNTDNFTAFKNAINTTRLAHHESVIIQVSFYHPLVNGLVRRSLYFYFNDPAISFSEHIRDHMRDILPTNGYRIAFHAMNRFFPINNQLEFYIAMIEFARHSQEQAMEVQLTC